MEGPEGETSEGVRIGVSDLVVYAYVHMVS